MEDLFFNQKKPVNFADTNSFSLQYLHETRSILLTGEVNKELSEKICRQLLFLENVDREAPIYIFIDSPGGDVDAGFAIFDTIRFVNSPVYTVGMGLVASAGALILLGAAADMRLAFPNSHYLIHQPLSGMRGVATAIEIHAREVEKLRLRINQLIAEETKRNLEQVAKDTDRDFWMNSQEALDYGLVAHIINHRKDLVAYEKKK